MAPSNSTSCSECSFGGFTSAASLRGHVASAHLAYFRFGCPLCPNRRFGSAEDALAHAAIEAHAQPHLVSEHPDLAKEERLRALLARRQPTASPKPTHPPLPPPSSDTSLLQDAGDALPPGAPDLSHAHAPPPAKKRRRRSKLEAKEEVAGSPDELVATDEVPEALDEAKEEAEETFVLKEREGEEEEEPERLVSPASEEIPKPSPRRQTMAKCRDCGEVTGNFLPHAITHAPTSLRAITCLLCPPDKAFSVAWQPSRLTGHAKAVHPGLALKFSDRRTQHKEEVRALMLKCFGFRESRGRKKRTDGGPSHAVLPVEEPAPVVAKEAAVRDTGEGTDAEEGEVEGGKPRARGGAVCAICGENSHLKLRHVIDRHMREKAIRCRLCPKDTKGAATAWTIGQLSGHFKRYHPQVPGDALEVEDRRDELRPTVDEWLLRCFNTKSRVRQDDRLVPGPSQPSANVLPPPPQHKAHKADKVPSEEEPSEEDEEEEEEGDIPHNPDCPGPSAPTPPPTHERPPPTFRPNKA